LTLFVDARARPILRRFIGTFLTAKFLGAKTVKAHDHSVGIDGGAEICACYAKHGCIWLM
jgi:hypothetical protein